MVSPVTADPAWTKIDYADPATFPDRHLAYEFLRCYRGVNLGDWCWAWMVGTPVAHPDGGFGLRTHSHHNITTHTESQPGFPEPETADWWRECQPT